MHIQQNSAGSMSESQQAFNDAARDREAARARNSGTSNLLSWHGER